MSYHYRPGNKKQQLLRELSQVENELTTKNKSLQRLKLQAEFYEDKGKPIAQDKLSLADQIMNQIISNPSAPAKNVYKQPLPYPQPAGPYKPVPIAPAYIPQNERQNNFINERQIQKIKMQSQKHQGLFPNSSDHNRVRSFGKQVQQVPQSDKNQPKYNQFALNNPQPKKSNSPTIAEKNYNADYNPFVKADEEQKKRKDENQRQYLKDLQLQRQQQQRMKELREKQEKMMKGQYYDFLPARQEEKPIVMKKTDPNSKPPKIEPAMGNYSQFDSNLIKSKAIQIKSKYKKGKISYEECQRQLNNLKKQYNGNFDDLIADNASLNNRQKEPQGLPSEKLRLYKQESPKKQFFEEQEKKQNNLNSFPIKNESINYSQFMPSMVPQQELPQKSNLNFSLPAQNMMGGYPMMSMMGGVPANIPPEYMELMKKMFEVCMKEVKEAYSQRLDHQDKAYQQTLNKFLQHSQNNFMTQQIPPIQASQQQKEFYSDAKQAKQYFDNKESNIKRKIAIPSGDSLANIPFGESDNSEYYDKSLSGIASKIPYNNPLSGLKVKQKNEKEQKILRQSGLQEFYNRKYKVKKLQKFPFLSDLNQPQLQIPSTSTYMRTKNALQELQMRFHEDLAELKKLQTQRNINEVASKMTKNTKYSSQRRILKEPTVHPVESANLNPYSKNQYQQNPFLKKHISNDDNMMTFNQKELRISSPINSYSPKSKKEILEQDQYQTEPRVREDSKKVPSYIQQYEERFSMPNKALDFIRMNNQHLNKYEKTEESKKELIMIRDEADGRSKDSNYFTNNDISPVKKSDNYYEESLQTIRSDFQSAQHSKRPPKVIDSANQLGSAERSNQRSSKQKEQGQRAVSPQMIGYSQTVESIEESSIKNSRPPVAKRRQVSKKKESSIVRSKANHDSSVSHPYNNDSLERSEMPKFDSNVYESQYEESADFQKVRTVNPQLVNNSSIDAYNEPNIEIYAPTIVAPKSAMEIEASHFNYQPKTGSAKLIQPQGKLKSLEQARKLAKEYRAKATDDSKEYKSVEQRFSELQSFMTKRGDQSVHSIRKEQHTTEKGREKSKEKASKGKRDIMKMLEELQDEEEDYKQDFESYREESEQYQ